MTRVFVTGASGFIGQHLVRALRAEGTTVLALVRRDDSARLLASLGAETLRGDLLDAPDLRSALSGVDVVFHLAAPRHEPDQRYGGTKRKDPLALLRGTRLVASAAVACHGVRMVHASSVVVYGSVHGIATEETPLAPVTDYGRARVEAEALCRDTFAASPERLVIARLTEVYGPDGETHRPIFEAIASGRFRVIGNGRLTHHISAVQDVVAALIACARTPAAGGKTMNVGSRPATLGEFADAVATASGTSVRRTPYLHHGAVLARTIFTRIPLLRRSFPAVNSALQYHLKESAYALDAADRWLGPQPGLPLEAAVEATLASYGLTPKA